MLLNRRISDAHPGLADIVSNETLSEAVIQADMFATYVINSAATAGAETEHPGKQAHRLQQSFSR